MDSQNESAGEKVLVAAVRSTPANDYMNLAKDMMEPVDKDDPDGECFLSRAINKVSDYSPLDNDENYKKFMMGLTEVYNKALTSASNFVTTVNPTRPTNLIWSGPRRENANGTVTKFEGKMLPNGTAVITATEYFVQDKIAGRDDHVEKELVPTGKDPEVMKFYHPLTDGVMLSLTADSHLYQGEDKPVATNGLTLFMDVDERTNETRRKQIIAAGEIALVVFGGEFLETARGVAYFMTLASNGSTILRNGIKMVEDDMINNSADPALTKRVLETMNTGLFVVETTTSVVRIATGSTPLREAMKTPADDVDEMINFFENRAVPWSETEAVEKFAVLRSAEGHARMQMERTTSDVIEGFSTQSKNVLAEFSDDVKVVDVVAGDAGTEVVGLYKVDEFADQTVVSEVATITKQNGSTTETLKIVDKTITGRVGVENITKLEGDALAHPTMFKEMVNNPDAGNGWKELLHTNISDNIRTNSSYQAIVGKQVSNYGEEVQFQMDRVVPGVNPDGLDKYFDALNNPKSVDHVRSLVGDFENIPGVSNVPYVSNSLPTVDIPSPGTWADPLLGLPGETAETFSSVTAKTLAPGQKIFRVLGDGQRKSGGFWTYELPQTKAELFGGTAVRPEWNSGTHYIEYTVPEGGLKIWEGPTASQQILDNINEVSLPGGATQIYIPDAYRQTGNDFESLLLNNLSLQ
jgi:hypothetical protein